MYMSKKLTTVKKTEKDNTKPKSTETNVSVDDDALKAVEQQLAEEDGLLLDDKETSDEKTESTVVTTDGPVYDASVASKPASEMTSEELKAAQVALKKRETTIGTKTTQNGKIAIEDGDGKRLDAVGNGKTKDVPELGGKITGVSGSTVKYEGELGSFEYDTNAWALGTKEVTDTASGVTTTIPVLRYIDKDNSWKSGDQVYGGNITIPEGLKSLDYSFENNKDLETVPKIPDSVESAHAAFKNCTKMTRAAKNAKEGESHGNEGLLAGAAAGAATGAAAGIICPGVGNVVGGLVGGGIGLVGGLVGGKAYGAKNDGKGGTWDMPDGLKDASEMFSGCSSLTEAYDAAGKNLINARSMYAGTKKLGTDEIANKFGSTAITDFNSDSKLSKEAVQDSYNGTNVELTDELKGNYSKDWDEETQTMNKADISAEEKAEVEALNQTLQEHDVVFGEENTDMTAQTDGLASSATVKTEHGYKSTTDVNEKNADSKSSDGSNLIDRGIVSLGEFWILKKVTGNALIAGVATFGLQAVGVLPKSMKPVLNAVTGFVGEDSTVGKMLSGIADKLPDSKDDEKSLADKVASSAEAKQDKAEKDASDKTNSTVDERVKSDMSSMKTITAKQSSGELDVSRQMAANGKAVAKDGVLLTAANKADNDQEFEDIKTMSMTMAAGLEEKAQSMVGTSGNLSDKDKKTLATQCMNVMNGMNAYDDGALEQIKTQYGENTPRSEQAKAGLGKVMNMSVTPMMDAIKEMDGKYHFLSKEDKQRLSNMEITGVTNYDDYQVGDMEKQVTDPQNVESGTKTTNDGQNKNDDMGDSNKKDSDGNKKNTDEFDISSLDDADDMSMYANAGLNDEIQPVSTKKTLSHAAMPVRTGASVQSSSVEARMTGKGSSTSNVSRTMNRGMQAENRFGNITKKESDVDYDYE